MSEKSPRKPAPQEPQVLILAPHRDGALSCRVLTDAGHACVRCQDEQELLAALAGDVGVLLLAEESLTDTLVAALVQALAAQPPWSDLPILVVTHAAARIGRLDSLSPLGNVSVLTRPMAIDALSSAVGAALRARRRQFEVRDLLAQQREQARRKDEFLAMLAHELRNPLAPVRYAAHALRLGGDSSTRTDQVVQMIDRQVGHMGRIIDQLLDVSRVTRGLIRLERGPVDLGALARAALAAQRALPAAEEIRVTGDIACGIWVDGDETRLRQVIDNLLDNALKFTPRGGSVQVRLDEDGDQARLQVIDEGDGIDATVLPFLFEAFTQADRSLDRARGGLGLGLALVKGLVDLHGGRVNAHSEGVGKGSRFEVRLPLRQDAAAGIDMAPRPASAESADRRLRVLIAEDNVDAADSLQMLLQAAGYEVVVTHSGSGALELARRTRPDAVLCDIGLPGINGYEVARALRADPLHRSARLIAITGYGSAEDRRLALAAGFDSHHPKPVAAADLLAELRSGSGRQAGRDDAIAA